MKWTNETGSDKAEAMLRPDDSESHNLTALLPLQRKDKSKEWRASPDNPGTRRRLEVWEADGHKNISTPSALPVLEIFTRPSSF
jgi:hypothetical protein